MLSANELSQILVIIKNLKSKIGYVSVPVAVYGNPARAIFQADAMFLYQRFCVDSLNCKQKNLCLISIHSSASSVQDACIAAGQEISPIDKDKNMIQIQKKRLNNTCKLSIIEHQQSNTNSHLVHFIEKMKCAESFVLNITFAQRVFFIELSSLKLSLRFTWFNLHFSLHKIWFSFNKM